MVTGGSVTIDGQLNFGIDAVNVFDPIGNVFFKTTDQMHFGRWYPSMIGLADGQILVQGGRGGDADQEPVLVPELFNPATGKWKLLTGATSEEIYGDGGWNYPRTFLAPNRKVFVMPNKKDKGYYLDTAGNGSLTEAITFPEATFSNQNLAVMYRQNQILSIRGRRARILTLKANGGIIVKDLDPLAERRFWAEATLLPNGEVLITGGSTRSQDRTTKVTNAQIWNPDTEKFRTVAAAKEARLYHASTILLPSGLVVTGGGTPGGRVEQLSAEVYYPDYLFKPDGSLQQRPRLLGRVPASQGRSIIEIRARGDEGTEEFNLVIGNEVVKSFAASKQMRSYFYLHNALVSGSEIRIDYTNDVWDPPTFDSNLTVDFIKIDGVRHDTEDSNVESLNLGEVGFAESDILYTNGYFQYWDQAPATPRFGSIIEIQAKGDEGTEKFNLLINDTPVRNFTVTKNLESYFYRHTLPLTGDQIKVELVDSRINLPAFDENLEVDLIRIDNKPHPTENPLVFSRNLAGEGNFRDQKLFTDGFFQYWDRSKPYLQLGAIDFGSTEKLFFDRAGSIEKVMLIRFGSATHSFDMGQRGVELDFTRTGRTLEIKIPGNPRVCPPGHYMLFVVSDLGIPSKAAIVEVLSL